MPKQLLVIKGPDKGKAFALPTSDSLLFGRGKQADGRLSDARVSRIHCEVELIKGDRVLLTDLDSTGTLVNGTRVEEALLKPGDVVRLGDTELRLDEVAAAPTAAIPVARILPTTPERLHELTGSRLSCYDIGPVLAQAQSGLVFKAQDFKRDRLVALKVLWPDFGSDDEDLRRFVRAMKTMLPLHHPHLVTLYAAGKTANYCWIAMELVEGESLAQVLARLKTGGILDWRNALRIAVYLTRALAYLHGNHVIHRNLTPTNVLIGATPEQTKLGDLVLAKATEGALAQNITKAGDILGDVRYMAPERARGGAAAADGRSDLYSLGALTYGLLTGRPPFEGKNLLETLTQIRDAAPVRPKTYQPGIPDLFERVVMRLLAKRPEDRYQTAGALLADLNRVAKLQGVGL